MFFIGEKVGLNNGQKLTYVDPLGGNKFCSKESAKFIFNVTVCEKRKLILFQIYMEKIVIGQNLPNIY